MSDTQEQELTDRRLSQQIGKIISKAVKQNTIEQLTKRIVREQLQDHFGIDLEDRKKWINVKVQEQVDKAVVESTSPVPQSSTSPTTKPSSSSSSKKTKEAQNVVHDEEQKEQVDQDTPEPENLDDLGDSDGFSSLDEEEVKTSRKSNGKVPDKKDKPAPRNKKKGPTAKAGGGGGDESKAERHLTRLKQLVTACGVRKPWKKLYEQEGIAEDDYMQQSKIVWRVLRELGMTGKGSLEHAKKIREKREFADELASLQENVIQNTLRGKRAKTVASKPSVPIQVSDEHDDKAGSDTNKETNKPKRRKSTLVHDDDDDDDSDSKQTTNKKSFKNSLASFAADLNSDSE